MENISNSLVNITIQQIEKLIENNTDNIIDTIESIIESLLLKNKNEELQKIIDSLINKLLSRRNFNGVFDEIDAQINGRCIRCDAVRYTTETENGIITGYCANMFNIGFDCNVADMTARMKKKPLISGSMAYFVSILANLISKKGENLKIEIDNVVKHRGKLLLTSIANGCYCGGGIKSNPLASICDVTININIIKNIPRLKFLRLLPSYMKGTFLNKKNINDIIMSTNCRKIVITPLNGKMRICVDGEIIDAGRTCFEICPGAFNFVIPTMCKDELKPSMQLV